MHDMPYLNSDVRVTSTGNAYPVSSQRGYRYASHLHEKTKDMEAVASMSPQLAWSNSSRLEFDVKQKQHPRDFTVRRVRRLAKMTLNLVIFVRPSVRMQLGSQWADFREIRYLRFFSKIRLDKIIVPLMYNNNSRYKISRHLYICDSISLNCS